MSKFTYTKNRLILPLLLLSILSLSSATIYYGSNPPYLASSVTLPKNLYQPPTVTDTDHQASDYWWDGTLPPKRDQQQKILLPNAIVTFPWLLPLLLLPLTTNLLYSQQPRRIWNPHFPQIPLPLLAPKINTLPALIVSSPPSLDQTLKYSFHQDSPHISTYTVLTVIMKPTTIYNSLTNSHLSF
jgi:hypothetical protein